MKRFVIFIFVLFLMTSFVYAASDDVGEGMGKKAVRGVVNLFTGIVELPAQVYKGFQKGFEPFKDNKPLSKTVGTVLGFFRGIGHAAGRMSWGALELFGFWALNPKDNEDIGIPLDAEYAWEEGEQYSIFEPNFTEGIEPVKNKLWRGLTNGFLGIAELPGQTMNGAYEGHPFIGLGKGVWYWFSREVYGLGDIFSCIVPNPKDNPGAAFPQEYPWDALAEDVD